MLNKCWCYANDWNAQKQDKDLLDVFLSLSGKSGLDQSLTPCSHQSHIRIVLVALLMLLWLPSCSKMSFAGGGIDKITCFYLLWARLEDPGSFSAIIVDHNHSTAQFLSLWNWICAVQGGAAILGESFAMARSPFRTRAGSCRFSSPEKLPDLGRTWRRRKSLDLLEGLVSIELGQNCFLGVLEISCLRPVRSFALKNKQFEPLQERFIMLVLKYCNPAWSEMIFRHLFPTFLFSLVLQATKYPSGPGGSGSVEWHGQVLHFPRPFHQPARVSGLEKAQTPTS